MLRWAILGTGFISNTVVEAIKLSEHSRVVLVAGRDRDRTAAFRKNHGIERVAPSYEEAVADPEVDVVYIGLPNHKHHEIAVAAAAVGKAILSEKSLTTTMESAEQLATAVRGRVFFVEGLMYLAHPVYRKLTELLTSPRIGTVRSIHGRYAANIAHLVNPLGSGTIYNLGCYPVSLLQLVVATTSGPDAFAQRALSGAGNLNADGVVSDATMTIRFGNGVLATISSTDDYGMAYDFAVVTDKGVLRFETNPWLPIAGSNVISWTPHDGALETVVVDDAHDAFYHQVTLVERSIAAGRTEAERPSPRLQDSLEIMGVLTAWEACCLSGRD